MTSAAVHSWLEELGYSAEPEVLHLGGESVPETHPYALEINTLLKPDGAVRPQAVFDVEGVPTVVFVAEDAACTSRRSCSSMVGSSRGRRPCRCDIYGGCGFR